MVELDEHEDEAAAEEEEHAASVLRLSPLVAWMPNEASILRLQYNYGDIEDDEDVHSVWLGLQVDLDLGEGHTH